MREAASKQQTATTCEKSRGRVERRTITTTTNSIDDGYLDWLGAKQFIRLERTVVAKGETRSSVTYAVTSLSREQADANQLLQWCRGRWHIENRCFYVLDNGLGEDASRIRTGRSGHAFSCIRHMALNLARRLGQTVGELCQEHAVKSRLLLQRLRILKE